MRLPWVDPSREQSSTVWFKFKIIRVSVIHISNYYERSLPVFMKPYVGYISTRQYTGDHEGDGTMQNLSSALAAYFETLQKQIDQNLPADQEKNVAGLLPLPPVGETSAANRHAVQKLNEVILEQSYAARWAGDNDWLLGKRIQAAQGVFPVIHAVAFLGKTGSHSHRSALMQYPEAKLLPLSSFAEACAFVLDGQVDAAVLPIDNSTAGTISDVYDLLLKHDLHIVKGASLPIHNVLLGVSGANAEGVREVWTHPQPLMQCAKTIKDRGWRTLAMESTAVAADAVARRNDRTIAAIGSREAAALYGLQVILEDIDDTDQNQTRFVTVMKEFVIPPDAMRVSLVFTVAHESGALAAVMSRLADFGLNVLKIQSRPIAHRAWEYSFHLDFESHRNNEEALKALYMLDHTLPTLKVLGWYASAELS